jgi:lipid-binding SYLF domain-containing protein
MVAAAQHPAHQADFLADLGDAQITAEMGAFPIAKGIFQGWDSFGERIARTVQAEANRNYIERPVEASIVKKRQV